MRSSTRLQPCAGAGDAFLAALLLPLLGGEVSPAAALQAACRLGAYVAGAAGATPCLDMRKVAALRPNDSTVKRPALAVPDIAPRASSERTWRFWAA